MENLKKRLLFVLLIIISGFSFNKAFAHCDTMNGPVITSAKEALKTNNVNLVLIWVSKSDEAVIRKAFQQTMELRKINKQVQEVVDRYFFETLVRIHRAGEGEPYIGILDSAEVEPGIAASDKALETASVDEVKKLLIDLIIKGVDEKFKTMMSRKNYKSDNIEAGREFVESYVVFMHYVEGIYASTQAIIEHHGNNTSREEEHVKSIENDQHQVSADLQHNTGDHVSHILIIVGVILIITVQIILSRKKTNNPGI